MVRTCVITVVCGLGHVGSSVLLGSIGIGLGIAGARLEGAEAARGDLAAWLLVAFGVCYLLWGLYRASRRAGRGNTHHRHGHGEADDMGVRVTPWVLFLVFVLGPCEPLIPILMVPAAAESAWGVAVVVAVFAAVTIGTMLVAVLLGASALRLVPTEGLHRYSHALAGAAVLACGVAIHLGL